MKQKISSFEPQPFEQAHIDTVRQCQTFCKCGRRPPKRWFSNHHQKVAQ